MGQLSRKEMEQVIASGGSVLYNGQTIWQVGQLPSAAELAKGDPEAESAAANDLQAQIADLQAQIAKLMPAPESKTEDPKTEDPKTDPPSEKKTKKAAESGEGSP